MKWREGEKMEREEILSLSISTLSPFPHSLPISSQPRCRAAAGYDSLLREAIIKKKFCFYGHFPYGGGGAQPHSIAFGGVFS